MPQLIQRFFKNQQAMQQSLFANTVYQLEKAIQTRATASLMVSGGSTPTQLYQSLATAPLVWKNIQVALVDERWVDSTHDASNEKYIRQNLLQHQAKMAKFINLKSADDNARQAQIECNNRYKQIPQPYDLTILGMGSDAHVASLFPNSDGLEEALNNQALTCSAITAHPSKVTGEYIERMTLTLSAIKKSRLIQLVISGEEKLEVYQAAKLNRNHIQSPVSAVLQQTETPVVIYWAP